MQDTATRISFVKRPVVDTDVREMNDDFLNRRIAWDRRDIEEMEAEVARLTAQIKVSTEFLEQCEAEETYRLYRDMEADGDDPFNPRSWNACN